MDVRIKKIEDSDRKWLSDVLIKEWGSVDIAVSGTLRNASIMDGFIAEADAEKLGVLTFEIGGNQLEIVTLNSFKERLGVGTKLLQAAVEEARRKNLESVAVTTTNNNLNALSFYQKRSFVISRVRLDAIKNMRKVKPEIPHVDQAGIPIRDEICLVLPISGD